MKLNPPNPAAAPRKQIKFGLRISATESTKAAEVRRNRRMLPNRVVVVIAGVLTVPTDVSVDPSVVIDVPFDGNHRSVRTSPICGCTVKSRPVARCTSSCGRPVRIRA